MDHFQKFKSREVLQLPKIEANGWQLKRYGILAHGKEFDAAVVSLALNSAIERLPTAGTLEDVCGNHGVGFQLIHFAEVAIVSPIFYWMWGSVLANTNQMRATWERQDKFDTGVTEVVGCIWEMQIVSTEIQAWTATMLSGEGTPADNLCRYLECGLPLAEVTNMNS